MGVSGGSSIGSMFWVSAIWESLDNDWEPFLRKASFGYQQLAFWG